MKFPRFLIVFHLFIVLASAAYGQPGSMADQILWESQEAFRSCRDITAHLSYTVKTPEMSAPLVRKGTLQLSGPHKYVTRLGDEEIYCDGQTVWAFSVPDREVNMSRYDPEEPPALLGLFQVDEPNAQKKYDGEQGRWHKITIFGAYLGLDTWKTELWIDKSTKLVSRATIYARNGSIFTYEMSGMKINSGLDPKTFTFDPGKYPDILVNDLRE